MVTFTCLLPHYKRSLEENRSLAPKTHATLYVHKVQAHCDLLHGTLNQNHPRPAIYLRAYDIDGLPNKKNENK